MTKRIEKGAKVIVETKTREGCRVTHGIVTLIHEAEGERPEAIEVSGVSVTHTRIRRGVEIPGEERECVILVRPGAEKVEVIR